MSLRTPPAWRPPLPPSPDSSPHIRPAAETSGSTFRFEHARVRPNGCRPGTGGKRGALLAVLLVLYPWTGFANSLERDFDLTGTVHDFATPVQNGEDRGDSITAQRDRCVVCHMTSTRDQTDDGEAGIAWTETDNTQTSWQMYGSSPAMLEWVDGNLEPAPTGSSKVCLSCHDGISAANHSDGRPAGASHSSGDRALGYRSTVTVGTPSGGLSNNHPISVTYAWTRDSQLHNPQLSIMGDGRSVQDLLENGRVECATCHDVHAAATTSNSAMLRTGMAGADVSGAGSSELCLVCHDK